jgi:hypothetical protein
MKMKMKVKMNKENMLEKGNLNLILALSRGPHRIPTLTHTATFILYIPTLPQIPSRTRDCPWTSNASITTRAQVTHCRCILAITVDYQKKKEKNKTAPKTAGILTLPGPIRT